MRTYTHAKRYITIGVNHRTFTILLEILSPCQNDCFSVLCIHWLLLKYAKAGILLVVKVKCLCHQLLICVASNIVNVEIRAWLVPKIYGLLTNVRLVNRCTADLGAKYAIIC